ncbi:menaquinol-cytochrome C reductase iron-sulfur subunit [Caldalkalibacillus thermarum]|uniref:QcrA and Rieske domain-containing protein n=1 Tax=Caldalkalibacillus thermarum TaxID=296745 RepID=UPI00166ACA34|nr:ubiquinol-cytochrome c reductase iron-sulfur subunit [Caldalkalibacillus thermarum]GGK24731.1 menaquinol-cytochrome C reductase iron-sulfur subunit [Caldalkalibacillus thermarum]
MSDKEQQQVSRRQFLNYTLMGVGGFLVSATITPMIRFAIDPVLKVGEDREMVPVGDISEFGKEYKRVDFKLLIKDGWAEYERLHSAWVRVLDNGEVQALSPVCTHLGCTVQWDTHDDYPNHFFCPCHDGLYDENGINIPGTPPTRPLDVYEYEVGEDGKLYLGRAVPREELG